MKDRGWLLCVFLVPVDLHLASISHPDIPAAEHVWIPGAGEPAGAACEKLKLFPSFL